MDKNEILKKSIAENLNNDPYELEVRKKAGDYGHIAGLVLCLFLYICNILVNGQMHFGYWAIIMLSCGVSNIYSAVKLKNKQNSFQAAAYSLIAVLATTAAVIQLFRG